MKYVTWAGDQWVSYDDAETFALKMDYANGINVGGKFKIASDLNIHWADFMLLLSRYFHLVC